MLLLAVPFGAVVSPYPIVGRRQVLLLDVPFDGGFSLSFPRCALGVGFRRYPEPEKALEFLFRLIWVDSMAFDLLAKYALRRESVYFGIGLMLTFSNETAAYYYSPPNADSKSTLKNAPMAPSQKHPSRKSVFSTAEFEILHETAASPFLAPPRTHATTHPPRPPRELSVLVSQNRDLRGAGRWVPESPFGGKIATRHPTLRLKN